ncbi:hypothetical protein EG346_11005 [Chryseobacterium carnipullorum]|uniref:Lipoprotein n=1 Tax=Chryseobacterium carnipullorum TaxID=1124835 RepID=A0A3G6N6G9_CHRCU|nr:hypothetical protein [Chryseobacterium carnipullorum]AZA48677.1 hypothetical protein EG346_11005 [Chryseobacterium carnipullorum]AZA63591.1 hypothetical protein EG345_01905 [Chryseobacterium carnipullorum]
MKKIILLFLFCLFSCTSQKNNDEFIQLDHLNAVVVGGDGLTVILIPTKKHRKRPVIVKIFRKGEYYDHKRTTYEKYKQIQGIILKIKQDSIEFPKSNNYLIGTLDGGSNSITLKKDNSEKKFQVQGISKKYHGHFYEAAELILEAAKLSINDID